MYKSLSTYIYESLYDEFLKLSEDDRNKLIDLDVRFHMLMEKFSEQQVHHMNVTNIDEQCDIILKKYAKGEDFNVELKYEPSKFEDDDWCKDMQKSLNNLRNDFKSLQCIMTKYYIFMIEEKIYEIDFFNKYSKKQIQPKFKTKPSKKVYEEAVKILKDNKFELVDELGKEYDRNISPKDAQKRLQKIIDDHKFGWKVIIDDNMIPRMSVRPYKEFRISATKQFSEVDIKSLEVHEIEVHTARKYWALQTGLYLFLYGLPGANIFDEGIAIYNSLNKVEYPKPNILFYIAIKIVMMYHLDEMSNKELIDFVKTLTDAPDNIIILSLIRVSRNANHTNMFTNIGNSDSLDMDYLNGYLMVKDMGEKQREELIKYSIGPDQIYELEKIKKFLSVNKFKPLDYRKEIKTSKQRY